jgi:retron-type reverse transcriptase
MKRNKEKQDRHFSIKALRTEWDLSIHKKSAGIDKILPSDFGADLDTNLYRIYKAVYSDSFGFRELRVVPIPKGNGKMRIICIPTVADKLVQRVAVRLLTKDKSKNKQYLSKQLELENNPIVYGLGNLVRPNSSVEDALKKAVEIRQNFPWVLKTDIQSFFDKIDRKILIKEFNSRFSNLPTLIKVVEKAINCESEKRKTKLLEANGIKRGVGIRQGMPLSPILSSFFLRKFDKVIRKEIGDNRVIRYADDIIAFASSKKECEEMKNIIDEVLTQKDENTIPNLIKLDDFLKS